MHRNGSEGHAVVTGGAGFIGSHMVDLLLDRGYRVTVIDNLATGRLDNLRQHAREPRLDVVEQDIRDLDPDGGALRGADYLFHFAGLGDIVPSIERPLAYTQANVDGTLAVLEAARHGGLIKLVYAASSSCYGANPPLPTAEDAPIETAYPYALSKYLGELAVLHWGRSTTFRWRRSASSMPTGHGCARPVSTAPSSGCCLPSASTIDRSRSSATGRSGAISSTRPTWRAHFC